MSGPTARTLVLLSLLQTHRLWKGAELARELGVTERTVRRDIDRLRRLGYPVDAGPGVDGGYRLAVGAHVPPLVLTDDEAVALAVGLRTTAITAIEGIEDTTLGLLSKLDQVLPDRLRRRIDALHRSVEVLTWSPDAARVTISSLTVLSQGCRDAEEVRFAYHRRDGEASHRLVQPHQLVSAGRRWYLVAWDVRRENWRTFRVDRMDDVRLAGARFDRRDLPAADAATFVREGMRASASAYRATVVVDASPIELEHFDSWFGGKREPLPDGRTRMEVSADVSDGLTSMLAILATRHDIEIIEAPAVVRAQLVVAARRLDLSG